MRNKKITLLVACLFSALFALAEGSKDLNHAGNTGIRIIAANENGAHFENYVYANAGEYILIASSAFAQSEGQIRIISPTGAVTVYDKNSFADSTGIIFNRTQEMNIPGNPGTPSRAEANFKPIEIFVPVGQAGIWTIGFTGPKPSSVYSASFAHGRWRASTFDWERDVTAQAGGVNGSGGDVGYARDIYAWDVTVSTHSVSDAAYNATSLKNGRLFIYDFYGHCNKYSPSGTDVSGDFEAHVLTNSGIVFDVKFDQMLAYDFHFFSNNKGIHRVSDNSPTYQSGLASGALAAHDELPNVNGNIVYKMFFNSPAGDMPGQAQFHHGGVTYDDWLFNPPPTSIDITLLKTIGSDGQTNSTVYGEGLDIFVNFSAPTNYVLYIDTDNDGNFYGAADVAFYETAEQGTNTITWDGLNAYGNPAFGLGENDFNIKVLALTVVHFPLYDIERVSSGISITRTNGPGAPNNTIYWDDSPLTGGSANLGGLSSPNHVWPFNDFGNDVTVDTWSQLELINPDSSEQDLKINVFGSDMEIVNIAGGADEFCYGDTLTFDVIVDNDGPSFADSAYVVVEFPAEVTFKELDGWMPVTGSADVLSSTFSGNTFRALVEMDNGSRLAFTFNASANAYPAGGTFDIKAATLRPRSYYDPGATNTGIAYPSDPDYDDMAAQCSGACNNLMTRTITVHRQPVLISVTDPGSHCGSYDLSNIVTVDSENVTGTTTSYHGSMPTSATDNPDPLTTITATDDVYVRVANTTTGCYDVELLNVVVDFQPDVTSIDDPGLQCGSFDAEDLTFDWVTSSGFDTTLHTAEPSNASDMTNIMTNSVLTSTDEVFIMVGNFTTGCYDVESIEVEVNPQPSFEIAPESEYCGSFDVTTLSLINEQNMSGMTVTYHSSAPSAAGEAGDLTTITDTTTIYVMASNATTTCFHIESIEVIVNPLPDLTLEDPNPLTECASFDIRDLDFSDASGYVGFDTTYHSAAPADENDMSNQITDFVLTTDQTVWVMLANTSTGCYDVVSVDLVIQPEPVAGNNIQGDFAVCDDETSVNLFNALQDDSWDAGGTWEPVGHANPVNSGYLFNAAAAGTGSYEFHYIVYSIPPCTANDTAKIIVIVDNDPKAGVPSPDTVETCNAGGDLIDLYNSLEGEQSGGSWSIIQGTVNAGTFFEDNGSQLFDPRGNTSGVYKFQYIVERCGQADTSVVTVNINEGRDSDGDGLSDEYESQFADTDGDGIDNIYDLDSDNDGIPDKLEAGPIADTCNPVLIDTDGDEVPDYIDLDSDNDGVYDMLEAGAGRASLDTDANGVIDLSVAVGANGLADVLETSADAGVLAKPVMNSDDDYRMDYRDLDSDNDGLFDIYEMGLDLEDVDTNEDGVLDDEQDDDGDGIANILDQTDALFGSLNGRQPIDRDGDGVYDVCDLDSDNDGLSDIFESGHGDLDGDNDGTIDDTNDEDQDGIMNTPDTDDFAYGSEDGHSVVDSDEDGAPDHVDLDSDNDMLLDIQETSHADLDADFDGMIDADQDSDLDGVADVIDADDVQFAGLSDAGAVNTDRDHVPDFRDLDSDNDVLFDIDESGNGDKDGNNDGFVDDVNDADGDGIMNNYDGAVNSYGGISFSEHPDSDGDGVKDFRDLDSDQDGISDIEEAGFKNYDGNDDGTVDDVNDADNDGIMNTPDDEVHDFGDPNGSSSIADSDGDDVPDYLDLDTDNDGITDIEETGNGDLDANADGRIDDATDADGDGIAEAVDADDDMFAGISDNDLLDTDGDGEKNHKDLDSDNDGIYDLLESGLLTSDDNGVIDGDIWGDANQDGLDDDHQQAVDSDGDGIEDYMDLDSDNDGIYDIVESGAVNADADGMINDFEDDNGDGADDNNMVVVHLDSDGDGQVNTADLDSDNDGLSDITEAGSSHLDTDNDGVVDGADSDGDGTLNAVDWDNGGNAIYPIDTDGDGVCNFVDLDSDDDSISDVKETGNGDLDSNNDGMVDGGDLDQDGVQDLVDSQAGSWGGFTQNGGIDTDGDNVENHLDLDSDNDGIADVIENGFWNDDSDESGTVDGGDSDGDGIKDIVDSADGNFGGFEESDIQSETDNDITDVDGDGIENYLDLDSDGDGIPDIVENKDQDVDIDDLDEDQDGMIDSQVDSDGDGIMDIVDEFDDDWGHFDNDLIDSNDNNIPDHLSEDSDGDGIPDEEEIGDDPYNPIDWDGDGIPDFQDPIGDLFIPETFSPNGDGVNDLFRIPGLQKYPDNKILIFNRWGAQVFEAAPYEHDWDGTTFGKVQLGDQAPAGTYYYILDLGTGAEPISGYIYINR